MKTTQPTHKKLPRGRVMFVALSGRHLTGSTFKNYTSAEDPDAIIRGAFLPAIDTTQARQIVRAAEFLRLSTEDKVERIRRHLAQNWTGSYEEDARAVLAAMGMGGASK